MPSYWRYLVAVLGLAIIAVGATVAMKMMTPQPAEFDLSRAKLSEKGLFSVAVEPEAGAVQVGPLHSWLLTVKTPQGAPVDVAEIAIDGGMPAHNHGLPTSPKVTGNLGEGRYRIEGVKFHMNGWWELRATITTAAGTDTAVFNLML